eukprot:2626091-Pyramimonas_sp.AAC.1
MKGGKMMRMRRRNEGRRRRTRSMNLITRRRRRRRRRMTNILGSLCRPSPGAWSPLAFQGGRIPAPDVHRHYQAGREKGLAGQGQAPPLGHGRDPVRR